jgi:pimeloyl-ACP methyl ester carboxylesterase
MTLFVQQGGRGPDLLVLLHGLGATGAVWQPLLAAAKGHWHARWLTLDLPGHGASPPQARYDIGDIAASVARTVAPHADARGRIVVLGHSLGGAVGLALASGEGGVKPQQVFGVGIKVAWSDEEAQRLAAIAGQPRRRFATEQEAWDRYLKVSGLSGLVEVGSPALARGVTQAAGSAENWCLAMDPGANAVGRPPFERLIAAARCPVHLARGSADPLVTLAQLRTVDPSAIDLAAQSHNVMIEAPDVIWEWLSNGIRTLALDGTRG